MAVMRDPSLPHQIVIYLHEQHYIAVSCNCIRRAHGLPLMAQPILEAMMAKAVYAEHLSAVNPSKKADHDVR